MTNQKLFEALERVCGFTALETDMLEIIRAVEADKMPMIEKNKHIIGYSQEANKEERIFNAEITKSLRTMTETIEQAAEKANGYNLYAKETKAPIFNEGFKAGATWQLSQPNPHRIEEWQVRQLHYVWFNNKMTHSHMVEILNEIAAGKHKERIEI